MSYNPWPNTTRTRAMKPMECLKSENVPQISWKSGFSSHHNGPNIHGQDFLGESLDRGRRGRHSQDDNFIMNNCNEDVRYNKINNCNGINKFEFNRHPSQQSYCGNNILSTKEPPIENKHPKHNSYQPIKSDLRIFHDSNLKPLEKLDFLNQEIVDIATKCSNVSSKFKGDIGDGVQMQKSATKMIHLREKLNLLQQSILLKNNIHQDHLKADKRDVTLNPQTCGHGIHGIKKTPPYSPLGSSDDIKFRKNESGPLKNFTTETVFDYEMDKLSECNTDHIVDTFQMTLTNGSSLDDWKTNRKRRRSYEPGEVHSYSNDVHAEKMKKQHCSQSGSPEVKKERLRLPNGTIQSKESNHEIRSLQHSTRPNSIMDEENNEMLSKHMWDYHERHHQGKLIYISKLKLRDALYDVIKNVFPYCGLYIIGSSMNGFCSTTSDMDMCLMLSHNEIDQRRQAIDILRALQKILKKCFFLSDMRLIQAKVPILKFIDTISKVECDLNINNSCGIRNTHLLSAYSSLDKRVPPLVLFVKQWARSKGINDASQGTLSSYSLVLMVIHYLQLGCHPPLLPSLQQKYPHKFDADLDIRLLTLSEKLAPFHSPNNESLAELFSGFIHYFSHKFCFEENVVSVRLGRVMPRSVLQQMSQYPNHSKFICIEEPFNLSNTAYSVFDPTSFKKIMKAFKDGEQILRRSDVNQAIASLTTADQAPPNNPVLTSEDVFTDRTNEEDALLKENFGF